MKDYGGLGMKNYLFTTLNGEIKVRTSRLGAIVVTLV